MCAPGISFIAFWGSGELIHATRLCLWIGRKMLLLTFQGCAGNLKVSGGVPQVPPGPLSTTWLRSSLGANEERVNAALIPGKPVDPTAGRQMLITAAGRHTLTGMVLWRSPNLLVLCCSNGRKVDYLLTERMTSPTYGPGSRSYAASLLP